MRGGEVGGSDERKEEDQTSESQCEQGVDSECADQKDEARNAPMELLDVCFAVAQ